MKQSLSIFGYGDAPPDWKWIVPFWDGLETKWQFFSTSRNRIMEALPGPHWGRVYAATRLNMAAWARAPDLITSIGPINSAYVEGVGQRLRQRSPHLAWAFNFTNLPVGRRRTAMKLNLRHVERMVVFSRMERALYAQYFDLPIERFHFVHWGANPPLTTLRPSIPSSHYVASLGGEARDYVTLCDAARRCPHIRFVLIARPHSLAGLDVPENIDVHVNLTWDDAWSIVAHAVAAVIPLATGETPNGHVTLVGGMHMGKAQVITASRGVADYAVDEENALLVPPHDPVAMATAIERLVDDLPLRERLGDAAQRFANTYCSERTTIDFARQQVREMLGV